MTRTMGVGLVVAGILMGVFGARFMRSSVVEAQASWQCKSWMLQKEEDAAATGTWLGQSRDVHVSVAGLSQSGLYTVLACKR
jgi:hypothetical protein